MNRKLLEEGLDELDLIVSDAAEENDRKREELVKFITEIELWNAAYGLVNATGEEIIVRHILDSLAPINIIKTLQHSSMADAGSGAGLPGIPLSIYMPESRFSLIERSGKRCRFLENQKAVLGLGNIQILEKGIEEVNEKFTLVVFRAFRPLDEPILKSLFRLLVPDGLLAAYKGKIKKIDEELYLASSFIGEAKIVPIHTPFLDEERHLVLISPPAHPV